VHSAASKISYDFIAFDQDERSKADYEKHFQPPYALCGADIKLPTLPEKYKVTYEANLLEYDHTIYVEEAFDYAKDALYRKFSARKSQNASVMEILENHGRQFVISDGLTCTEPTVEEDNWMWKRDHDSNGHVKHVKELLAWSSSMNYEYDGARRVRGILCDKWKGHVDRTFTSGRSSSFTIEYFFSLPLWRIRGSGAEKGVSLPVRIHIKGKSGMAGAMHSFEHNYEFSNFHTGEFSNTDKDFFTIPGICPTNYGDGGVVYSFDMRLGLKCSHQCTMADWATAERVVKLDMASYLGLKQYLIHATPPHLGAASWTDVSGLQVHFNVAGDHASVNSGALVTKLEALSQAVALAGGSGRRSDNTTTLSNCGWPHCNEVPQYLGGLQVYSMSHIQADSAVELQAPCKAADSVSPTPIIQRVTYEDCNSHMSGLGGFICGILVGVLAACVVPMFFKKQPPVGQEFQPQVDDPNCTITRQPEPSDGLPGCLSADDDPRDMGHQPVEEVRFESGSSRSTEVEMAVQKGRKKQSAPPAPPGAASLAYPVAPPPPPASAQEDFFNKREADPFGDDDDQDYFAQTAQPSDIQVGVESKAQDL